MDGVMGLELLRGLESGGRLQVLDNQIGENGYGRRCKFNDMEGRSISGDYKGFECSKPVHLFLSCRV